MDFSVPQIFFKKVLTNHSMGDKMVSETNEAQTFRWWSTGEGEYYDRRKHQGVREIRIQEMDKG